MRSCIFIGSSSSGCYETFRSEHKHHGKVSEAAKPYASLPRDLPGRFSELSGSKDLPVRSPSPEKKMEMEHETPGTSSGSPGGSREYKVVMLGSGGVGKSAMTMQFISHRFPDYHDPTIEDAYKAQVQIDNEPAYLDILDTAGQAEFTAMRDQYMRGGEGFIICYSITDRQSFQEAAEFKELIYRVRRTYDIPLVLVGNKIDLKEFRQVSREEGMNLARQYGCPFFETSAAFHFYIDDVFYRLVREIRKRETSLPLAEGKLKSKDSLWQKLKGSLKKKKESPS